MMESVLPDMVTILSGTDPSDIRMIAPLCNDNNNEDKIKMLGSRSFFFLFLWV
jgi:hypothetical protein